MENLKEQFAAVKLGRAQVYRNMALFPLLAPDAGEPGYLTLEEALARGELEIGEKDTGGSVPELLLVNRSASMVLIVAGEELIGAKQNRVVNATFLVAAHAEVILPVSCVEQGRWAYRSEKFAHGKRMMHASLREVQQRDVQHSQDLDIGFMADQSNIWSGLDEKIQRMQAPASSRAMSDLFESQRDYLGEFCKSFRLVECQVGGVFAINGKVAGLELYGYQDTFGKFFEKLVQSYALDAIDWMKDEVSVRPRQGLAKGLLERTARAPVESRPSLDLGRDVRLKTSRIVGAGLEHEGELLQLTVFRTALSGNHGSRVGFRRFSRRELLF